MKRILKWAGILLASLLLLAGATAFYLNNTAKGRLAKKYDVQPNPVLVPNDSASLAAGKMWASTLCAGCHGDNLAGTAFFTDPDLGAIHAPNLTPGGVGKSYTDIDWLRAIRRPLQLPMHAKHQPYQ